MHDFSCRHPFSDSALTHFQKAYRLRLFLGRFGVRAAALNSDLPLTSRTHMLDEFNRGIFDLLIATDEGLSASMGGVGEEDESGEEWEEEEDEEEEGGEDDESEEDEMEGSDEEEGSEEDGDEEVGRGRETPPDTPPRPLPHPPSALHFA